MKDEMDSMIVNFGRLFIPRSYTTIISSTSEKSLDKNKTPLWYTILYVQEIKARMFSPII